MATNPESVFGDFNSAFQSSEGGEKLTEPVDDYFLLKQSNQQDEDWGDFGGFEAALPDCTETVATDEFAEFRQGQQDFCSLGHKDNLPIIFMTCFGYLSGVEMNSSVDAKFRLLSNLQESIDFTSPLCKWDTSYIQTCYYSSIKVDPVLVSKVVQGPISDTLSVTEGQSAALDLMESFGFEGAVEPNSPTDPSVGFLAANAAFPPIGHSESTLLDLSLPNSPSENLQEDSFTLDADLQGLELQALETERPRTSIEQLALNERLVVNRTTWIDSELEKLGDIAISTADSNNHDQNTGLNKKASFQEQLQQLGLDTSKTSFTTTTIPAVPEMSIPARLILDRLPNLYFMLQEVVVDTDNPLYHR